MALGLSLTRAGGTLPRWPRRRSSAARRARAARGGGRRRRLTPGLRRRSRTRRRARRAPGAASGGASMARTTSPSPSRTRSARKGQLRRSASAARRATRSGARSRAVRADALAVAAGRRRAPPPPAARSRKTAPQSCASQARSWAAIGLERSLAAWRAIRLSAWLTLAGGSRAIAPPWRTCARKRPGLAASQRLRTVGARGSSSAPVVALSASERSASRSSTVRLRSRGVGATAGERPLRASHSLSRAVSGIRSTRSSPSGRRTVASRFSHVVPESKRRSVGALNVGGLTLTSPSVMQNLLRSP